MLEWQVSEDDTRFHETLEEEPPSRRGRIPWRLLLAFVLGCALLALGLLRWRIAERDAAIRRDITRFVTEEERSRLFGLTENLPRLVARDEPTAWQAAYLGTFLPANEAQSLAVEVETIELHGAGGALVTLHLDGQPQVRYYRLEAGRGWRRAPLPNDVWGEEIRFSQLSSLLVSGRDEAFGETLAHDLATLYEQLGGWAGWRRVESVRVFPTEFAGPLVDENGSRIVLNSPLLLSYPRAIGGEGAVRFALAQALFRRAGPDLPQQLNRFTPPESVAGAVGGGRTTQSGVGRFVDAARNVSAMRWALSPGQQEQLRARWREELHAERWFSPFLTSPQTRQYLDIENPTRAEASALLAADYLYEARGSDTLTAIVNGTAQAQSWDVLLQATVGRFAVELDQEVAAYARGGMAAVQPFERSAAPISLPLQVTSAQPLLGSLSQTRADVPGSDEPILVQAAEAVVQMPDGTTIPPDCVSLSTSMKVDGDWLELGTRLRATHITLSEVLPPRELALAPAPSETIAYLTVSSSETGETVATLLALQPDGTATPLGDVSNVQISPLIQQSGYPARFLVQLQVSGCNWIWILLYDPDVGVVRRWVAPPTFGFVFMQALWHPNTGDVNDLLVFIYPRASSGAYYSLLDDAGPLLVAPSGKLAGNLYPLGIHADSNRVVMMHWGQGRVEFLDPVSGDFHSPIVLASSFINSTALSADGRYLTYVPVAPLDPITSPPVPQQTALHILDLTTRQEQALPFPGEMVHALLGNQMGNEVLAVVGPPSSDGLPPARSRLLLIDPADASQQTTIATFAPDEQISWAFSCSQGRVLYELSRRATSGQPPIAIRLWNAANRTTTTLLQTSHHLQPLACP